MKFKTAVLAGMADSNDERPVLEESCSISRRRWLSSAALAIASTTAVSPHASASTASMAALSTKNTCDTSVSVWQQPSNGRKVYLLGTAHISSSSALLAGDVIDDVRPDAVFVEMDAKRLPSKNIENSKIQLPEGKASSTEKSNALIQGPVLDQPVPTIDRKPTNQVSSGGLALGGAAVGTAIKGMYGQMSKEGFNPGEEFAVAIRKAQDIDSKIILGDRDVDVTLQRLSQALRRTDLKKLFSPNSELEASMNQMMPTKLNTKDLSYKDEMSVYVETMKEKENVKLIMAQLKNFAPEIYEALVAERDAYMGNGLDKLNVFPVIVAVMGMAHVDGVENYLKGEGWARVPLMCKAYLPQ